MEKHFAALRIPDADSDYKLTRALSFSELPSARRICVEQCYESADSPGLVRQYSCEQIFDAASNTRQVKISEIVKAGNDERKNTWEAAVPSFNVFKIPEYRPPKVKNVIQPSKLVTDRVEYMDVDEPVSEKHPVFSPVCPTPVVPELAKQTNKISPVRCQSELENNQKEIISSKEIHPGEYKDLKKKFRPLVPNTTTTAVPKKSNMCSWCMFFFLLLPVAFTVIAIFLSHDDSQSIICDHKKSFLNASIELEEKVYGQGDGIYELISQLTQSTSPIRILSLVGGTGVGKSFTAEIIRRNFPHKRNVFLYFPPLGNSVNVDQFSRGANNLLILENLRQHDIFDVVNLSKSLMAVEDCCVTVLAIFNLEHVDNQLTRKVNLEENVEAIRESFHKENVDVAIIGYKALTDETLEKCIMDAAGTSRLELNRDQIERIKETLLLADSGCKGAYSKVQVIGRE